MPRFPLQAGWRVLVPVVVAGVVAAALVTLLDDRATQGPPDRTPDQLLDALRHPATTGYSGTLVQKSALILPQLNASTDPTDGLTVASLVTGSTTLRVWYGGPDRQRIAAIGRLGETDVFRDGSQVWQWQSLEQQAVRGSASSDATTAAPLGTAPPTPDELAQLTLSSAERPGVEVSTESPTVVAGRAAYRLVVTVNGSDPSDGARTGADAASRVGRVVVSIDCDTDVPLAAQVYASSVASTPALDVAFERIDYRMPDPEQFRFVPPPDTAVIAAAPDAAAVATTADYAVNPEPLLGMMVGRRYGEGWAQAAVVTPASPNGLGSTAADASFFDPILTTVSGTWGTGRLLQSPLISVLFVSDGRTVVGAVDPSVLYAALG